MHYKKSVFIVLLLFISSNVIAGNNSDFVKGTFTDDQKKLLLLTMHQNGKNYSLNIPAYHLNDQLKEQLHNLEQSKELNPIKENLSIFLDSYHVARQEANILSMMRFLFYLMVFSTSCSFIELIQLSSPQIQNITLYFLVWIINNLGTLISTQSNRLIIPIAVTLFYTTCCSMLEWFQSHEELENITDFYNTYEQCKDAYNSTS
jgi:hypothetical protein